jgi:hypothetical protein
MRIILISSDATATVANHCTAKAARSIVASRLEMARRSGLSVSRVGKGTWKLGDCLLSVRKK